MKKIHFVGIGGIGISGLARYMQAQGIDISGSDIAVSSSTNYLKSLGVNISIPHNKSNITSQDLVIHSAIIRDNNEELIEAKKKNIPVLSRSEALKIILKQKRVFSVCGAHGKSSTTAMLSSILNKYGAIIGAESKEFGSNVRAKKNKSIVFEADESDGSFINSNPYCAIVTNAEPEHMEYYNYDLDLFHSYYKKFLKKAKTRVINAEDEFLSTLKIKALRLLPSKDIRDIKHYLCDDEPYSSFSLYNNDKFIGDFEVWGFGFHTLSNASLAILASLDDLDSKEIKENLLNYKGIKKRFDIVCNNNRCIMIDDYAHHPTEIKSTLDSIKYYAKLKKIDKLSVIWQPHKYSRTINNIDGFSKCFKGVDKLIILPVWRAYEEPIDIDFYGYFRKYSPLFADEINRNGSKIEILKDNNILDVLDSGLIVGFGAGDITYQMRGLI
ncbi:UDP-N-acetylmuramate--L-alanine ligase [Helicobacter sp. MIT 14-3879]|nr:UDP-N-acetylmuramate--L-alanine ligase [Helicobacter sp. MIT 14-3879]